MYKGTIHEMCVSSGPSRTLRATMRSADRRVGESASNRGHPILNLQRSAGNQAIRRMLARVSESSSYSIPSIQRVWIQNCSFVQDLHIQAGLTEAGNLVRKALNAILGMQSGQQWVRDIAENHFGRGLTTVHCDRIVEVYRHILNTLDSKAFTCDPCLWEPPNPDHHHCALGECPGAEIMICPPFGGPGCPPGPIIVHEAAHNAGACADVRRRSGNYPPEPGVGVENAYSYEYFAVEVSSRRP